MNRLAKVFEANESYIVRFLPNINDIPNSNIRLEFTPDINPVITQRYFSYILRDNTATPVTFGKSINDMLQYCVHGYTGTPEGHFITKAAIDDIDQYPDMFDKNDQLNCYFANESKTVITLSEYEAKKKGLLKFSDMVVYSQRNPFDIQHGISLSFDTTLKDVGIFNHPGFLVYENMKWINSEPLWNKLMPKTDILNLYKDVANLVTVVESEVEYLQRVLKTGTILTGDAAKKCYWTHREKKINDWKHREKINV